MRQRLADLLRLVAWWIAPPQPTGERPVKVRLLSGGSVLATEEQRRMAADRRARSVQGVQPLVPGGRGG